MFKAWLDAERKQQRDRSTNTREQRAKIAGVSAGTVARYDTVMNSDNKELKKRVQSVETSIVLAVKNLHKKKTKKKQIQIEKKIICHFLPLINQSHQKLRSVKKLNKSVLI